MQIKIGYQYGNLLIKYLKIIGLEEIELQLYLFTQILDLIFIYVLIQIEIIGIVDVFLINVVLQVIDIMRDKF